MVNECDVLISKICRSGDTVYRHQFETGCFPYFLTNDRINCSAISMLLSYDMRIPRIVLSNSIAIHAQTNSFPTLIRDSSTMNS